MQLAAFTALAAAWLLCSCCLLICQCWWAQKWPSADGGCLVNDCADLTVSGTRKAGSCLHYMMGGSVWQRSLGGVALVDATCMMAAPFRCTCSSTICLFETELAT
ncbi:hypothetical protein COO60DRAFT_1101749 [Scenedesmus sp. NREL 46B-D3]|nr:hypothetical protein COO60DRAFT_1101749 [Scenedesmus sp. NREL 46B-D3]